MNVAFDPVISAERLTRYFGHQGVVRDLDLRIPPGQVSALLGLNGAGKTTTIRIIMGLLRPTRGSCHVFGEDSASLRPETRRRIGYMVEGHYLYPSMRVDDCAAFQGAGYARWDDRLFNEITDHFGISRRARIGELSRGQRAGVALALVLAPDPELLVLDDPALGLDPVSRRALNETLVEFAADGQRTVLLSTHLLDDVERIADRLMLMVDGHLKVDSSMDEFRARVSSYVATAEVVDTQKLAAIPGLIESRRIGSRWQLSVADADAETHAAIQRLGMADLETAELTFSEAVLAYLSRQRRSVSFSKRATGGVE